MKYLRTFIALPVKVDYLFLSTRENFMQKLDHERISWVDPANFHVTLSFLGETSEDRVDLIRQSMSKMKNLPEKTIVQMGQVATFGPQKKPRVVWLGFGESSLFGDLKKEVDGLLENCGLPVEAQKFRAHLTLGRVRSLKDLNGYYNVLDKSAHCFKGEILFDKLAFYRSMLGPGGPVYTPLKELSFKDQAF